MGRSVLLDLTASVAPRSPGGTPCGVQLRLENRLTEKRCSEGSQATCIARVCIWASSQMAAAWRIAGAAAAARSCAVVAQVVCRGVQDVEERG